ncbi:MAG: transporter substrate-binding domain-containing protein, partial [Bacillota bacterium]|nr:transporter substrate-binding domain-containing protein [Bacillota bacterium]
MSIRKKIFMLLIVLITISFLFSFSFASEKLKVGYFDDYPLLFDDNGKPVGFIVEILDEFAKNENYEIKYIYGTWAESLNRLKNGEIDLIGSVSQSEKRDVYFDFNENPLMMLWGTISVNSNFRVESILDLSGLKVGYIKNDYYAVGETGMIEIAKEFELDTEFISYDTYQEMFKAIEKNEVNAGITSDVAANQIYDYKNIKSTIINFAANGIKFATKNNENNEILKKLDENIYNWKNDKDSFYYKRYDFWFKDSVRNQYEIFYYENKYKILFFTLLTILTIMFSKFQVNYKTKELKEINKDLEKANFKIRASQTNIEASYENINGLVNQFENLVDFISRNMKSSHNESEESFLKELLKESIDLVKEADSGYVFA